MGEELKLRGEEAVRLAGLGDGSTERGSPEWARREYRELRAIVDDIHRHLAHPLPRSNHDRLYDDETGLPR